MENNNNNNNEMMVEMRQLLKQLIALLKQQRRSQKVNQPTGYTLYRRDGGRAWEKEQKIQFQALEICRHVQCNPGNATSEIKAFCALAVLWQAQSLPSTVH